MNGELLITLGYIIFTIYAIIITFLGVTLEKRTKISSTVCRKITHIVSVFFWVICYVFFGCTIHWVLLNGIGTVILCFMTFSNKFSFFGRSDSKISAGLFYFGISTFIVSLICYFINPDLYLYAGIAYCCLALGDGFAPIIALLFKKNNPEILPNKTLFGTLTVFAVSFLSTLAYSLVFNMQLSVIFILSVAALTCISEFYGCLGLDNIFIDFSVFGYLTLYHYGLVSLTLQIVIIASPFLACLSMGSKSMSRGAGVCAFLLFAMTCFFSRHYLPTIFIVILFALSTAVSLIAKRALKKREHSEESEPRKANQIIAVGLFALVMLILHYYSDIKLFYYIFFLSITEQFADSMASDIGRFTKRKNINIITFKPIEKGLSGGVSLLGTFCALISAFVIMTIPLIAGAIQFKIYLFISLFAFVGTIFDSILGASLQSLYICNSCEKRVETVIHCKTKTTLIKGFRIVDNTAVNYITGFLTCALGLLLAFV